MSPQLPATISPLQLATAVERRAPVRLLDVRTTAEFERVHIAGSYNVPLHELNAHAGRLSAAQAPIVLVCRSGARARVAEEALRRACVRDVAILDGGILSWRRHGLPVLGAPLTPGAVLRRMIGIGVLVLAAITFRENPLVALMVAFVGVRLASGQSVMPCAMSATCSVAPDFGATVTALIEARPVEEPGSGAVPEAARNVRPIDVAGG